jgi:hypothetical protein
MFLPPQPARVLIVTHYPLNFVYYVYFFFAPTLTISSQSYITIWNVKIFLSLFLILFICFPYMKGI